MLKKIFTLCVLSFLLSGSALAIEPPAGATVPWIGDCTAYTSRTFDAVLQAYGLTLSTSAIDGVPSSYGVVSGDRVVFNDNSIAYPPIDYHAILTAYGLTLEPEAVRTKLGNLNYAAARGDTIVFGSVATAYNPAEWRTILSAYGLEMETPIEPAEAVPAAPLVGDSDGDGVPDDKDACPDTPKGIEVDERGCWSLSATLLFDFDKAVIRTEYYQVLDQTRSVFEAYPDMQVRIDGHTCDIGSELYNQGLSERRAQAVYDYLVESVGINSGRLSIAGHGESKPAYPNTSRTNREKNRRVEFTPLR